MIREKKLAEILFAIGLIGIGALSVISGDFAFDWQNVPAFHPGRGLLAVFCGVFTIAVSIALLFRRSRAFAVRAIFLYLVVWQFLKIPRVILVPQIEGVWLGFGEIGMLLAGGWVLFARLSELEESALFSLITGKRGVRIAQILFGLAVIPVGLGHIFYTPITATLIPSWMPFHLFLAYFTGVVQIGCGLAILFSFFPRIAALIETAMLALFAFFVWGPDTWTGSIAKAPGQPPGPRFPLTGFLITWVIGASALLIANSAASNRVAQGD
jgi:uncharacterized membrane protein YphA (DoxX/SURF4 family)